LNLEEDNVGVVLWTNRNQRRIYCKKEHNVLLLLKGEQMVGRVVNTLGFLLWKGPIGDLYEMPLKEKLLSYLPSASY
jgi:F0F1-type ATP synthase alpha subunit